MTELSFGAKMAWQLASKEAAVAGFEFIEPDHILIGIFSLEKALIPASEVGLDPKSRQKLESEQETIEIIVHVIETDSTNRKFSTFCSKIRRGIRSQLGKGGYTKTENVVHRSPACKFIFERACTLAASAREVTCIHLLSAILEQPTQIITSVLQVEHVDPDTLRERALAVISAPVLVNDEPKRIHVGEPKQAQAGTQYLDRFGRDLTQAAREGKLGPFIGRRPELLQIIQTLARRSKNNPVLVGEAGVGKTAVVEALAIRVVDGKDPEVLAVKLIVELSIGALTAGTQMRGEFEERLENILKEAQTHPEVILFIDEIHNLVGAGQVGNGSMDAANIIKPALARGELCCIGATTITEYRRYIEADSALERRFEKIIINEPSLDEAVEILKGLRQKLEEHHHVRITDQAIQAAVDLSVRFDGEHQLPDKAIDLVDKAGARTRVPLLSMRPGSKTAGDSKVVGEVTEMTIAQVLSEKIGVPLEIITGHMDGLKKSPLLELEAFLKTRIVGQDDAVKRVSQRLLMEQTGLSKRRGPLAIFMFLGPSGVGKTELARSLAMFLFGSDSDMIRLDMSEYMEEYSVSKLIGSPPGYIGHEEEGQLTGQLRTKPYSVVLLDEVEKAHPRVFDTFLQVFDDGRLTDSKGRTADAKNAIFIMTSNILADKHGEIGFKPSEQVANDTLQEIAKHFRPEFINRIDDQIVFRSLNEEDVRKIVKPMLTEICQTLQKQYKATLQVDEQVEILLAQAGFIPKYGARELHRTVEKYVQIPLSELILSGKLSENSHWNLIRKGEDLEFIQIKQ
jgi:ATP-dependent Clp protease ATP-binding subunit ClpC